MQIPTAAAISPMAQPTVVLQSQNFPNLSHRMALRHATSRGPRAVERLRFVTTIRASPLRRARRGARPRRVHLVPVPIDGGSALRVNSGATPAPNLVASLRWNRWPGRRNRWPGHRNRWPGPVGTGGRVPPERVAGSRRNTHPGARDRRLLERHVPSIGVFDEVAIWRRALTPAEVASLHRRGALRLSMQVRACADASCGDAPSFAGPGRDPSASFWDPPGSLAPDATVTLDGPQEGRFFQYKARFESDVPGESPALFAATVTGAR